MGQGYVGLPLAMRAARGRATASSASRSTRRNAALRSRPGRPCRGRLRRAARAPPSSRAATVGDRLIRPAPASTSRSSRCPTPLRDGAPDLSFIESAGRHARAARALRLPLSCSSRRPTRARPRSCSARSSRRAPASRAGADFHLGYSPGAHRSRATPTWTLENTPKVVSGIDERVARRPSRRSIGTLVDKTVPVSRCTRRPSSPSCSRTPSGT